jgi:hypothetical protein
MVSQWAAFASVLAHAAREPAAALVSRDYAAQDLAAALPASAAHPRFPQHALASPRFSVLAPRRDRSPAWFGWMAAFDAWLVR